MMNYNAITRIQKLYLPSIFGNSTIQDLINSGQIWHLEGTMGRHAMDLLRSGVCMLPLKQYSDYYGNLVPARTNLKPGTAGTFSNCSDFWKKVNDGDIDAIESLDYI